MHSDKIEKIVENESYSIQEAVDKINKVENKIKYKAFGKVTINNKEKSNKVNIDNEEKPKRKMLKKYLKIKKNR